MSSYSGNYPSMSNKLMNFDSKISCSHLLSISRSLHPLDPKSQRKSHPSPIISSWTNITAPDISSRRYVITSQRKLHTYSRVKCILVISYIDNNEQVSTIDQSRFKASYFTLYLPFCLTNLGVSVLAILETTCLILSLGSFIPLHTITLMT